MNLSDNGLRLIIGFEGKHRALGDGRYIAYKCPADVWTIYAGVTEGVKAGMICTEQQGEVMFRRELDKHEAAVNQLVTAPLNQNQFDALVSFSYNCGASALAQSTLLRRLNAGDLPGAAAQFARWNKGGGKVLPGLVARRAREAALFVKPPDVEAPQMPQAVDPPPPAPATATLAKVGVGVAGTAATALSSIQISDTFNYGTQALNLVKTHGLTAAIVALFAITAWCAAIKHSELNK